MVFNSEVLSLFVLLAGFVIGLGAVTVIDIHGFLGRKSGYWTLATTRTHKVTKPLIWLGILLHLIGLFLVFDLAFIFDEGGFIRLMYAIDGVLILNGLFLTFGVSRFLLRREAKGESEKLLPFSWQWKITVSFLISFFGWWGNLLLLCAVMFG